tara:strand:+ start:219 stop:512 length:294 start_codon:yes stop_codon:yes gene_type:complete
MGQVIKAIPSIEENTNNVMIWELFALYSTAGATSEFYFMYDCKQNNNLKPLSDWTKTEIESLFPQEVFANAFNNQLKLKASKQNDIAPDTEFDINSL